MSTGEVKYEAPEQIHADDREKIIAILDEFNAKFMKVSAADHAKAEVAIVVRDAQGEVIGGLLGHVEVGWLNIDKLAVASSASGRGVGRRLLEMAEDIARKRKLTAMYVTTREWQAPGFYEKLGFTRIDTRYDLGGNVGYHYKKSLMDAADPRGG